MKYRKHLLTVIITSLISLLLSMVSYADGLSGASSLKWATNTWTSHHLMNNKSGIKTQNNHANNQNQQLKLTSISPLTDHGVIHSVNENYDPEGLFAQPNAYNKQAFHNVATQAMPLTPAQIVQLKRMLTETQRASAASPTTPPKPTVSTQIVSLAPGTIPPIIRLQQGFVTSVVFVDSTGANWPIDSYDLGNSRAFNIQVARGSNTMMIQALNMYTYGNLAVKLKGLSTPVMLTLLPGQQVVDYRVDLRIQGSGPDADSSINQGVPSAVNSTLLSVLEGIPPTGARTLKIDDNGESQAWVSGNKMYLRTRRVVLSPSWKGEVTSPDGTRAYEMDKSPMVLVSKYGRPTQLTIEGL